MSSPVSHFLTASASTNYRKYPLSCYLQNVSTVLIVQFVVECSCSQCFVGGQSMWLLEIGYTKNGIIYIKNS